MNVLMSLFLHCTRNMEGWLCLGNGQWTTSIGHRWHTYYKHIQVNKNPITLIHSIHTFNECHTSRCYFVLHHSCLYCPSLFPKTNKTCRNVYKFINVQQRGSRVWHHSSRDTCLWIKEYSENTYAKYHSEIIIMIQNKHQLFQNIWKIKEMEDLLQRISPGRRAQILDSILNPLQVSCSCW